jgi:segregation and condensation protein B
MADPDDIPAAAELGRSYQRVLDGPAGAENGAGGGETATEPAGDPPPSVVRIIEALLFVGGPALTQGLAGELVRGLTREQFAEAVQMLNLDYRRQGRPYAIVAQGDGFVLRLKARYRDVPERIYGAAREARLSTAAIDVLSLVAYRQPATKQEIDSLRGAESGALLRQLVRRGLVSVTRRADAEQREVSYGTTARFLELFGISNLEDLPRTQDLQQM